MSGIGGGAMSVDRIMAMRQQILEKNQALSRANQELATPAPVAPAQGGAASFADALEGALGKVNQSQHQATELSAAYERGETIDIAKVMLARQQASVGFEATLQVRNKLLSAYKDIMSMPV
ncbi:flagellar hook-basal body complex protein FliE [Sphingomonas baiyangensis]|uniref:Flagellar hook-basal body complex protein FliE n=1 Tax=Sphingomonas baiyangensis TaxID=2572576 RepID=A0A4V5PU24_9SPHN|nr:flagellar hook-basal body complex protein FliE [Sphingomonas baiyangensis]